MTDDDRQKLKEKLEKLERWHKWVVRSARFLSPLCVIGTTLFAANALHYIQMGEKTLLSTNLDIFALVCNVFASAVNLRASFDIWILFDWNGNLRKGKRL